MRPANSMGQFGDKFRKARDAKGISLDDVSNVTKISARNLKAIEEERFDQLPGGVFNRGFIRAYAKHLGLNDEEAVTDYLACLRQAQIDAHEVWQPEPAVAPRSAGPQISTTAEKRPAYEKPSVKTHAPAQIPVETHEELPELQLPRVEHVRPPAQKYLNGHSQGTPWKLIAVATVVVVLAIVLWTRHSRATRTEAANAPAQPAAPVAQPVSTPASPPVASNQPPEKKLASTGKTATSSTPSPAKPIATGQPSSPQPSKSAASGTAQAPPEKPDTKQPEATNEGSDVTVRDLTKPAVNAKPATTMTLVIRATENSWISVTADGQQVSQETLIAPAHASIRASREIVARVGNAAGVTFLFNGQEIAAQGAEAEVKTYVFDANGMHEIANQPNQ
jgi:cytoskeletal protein RodZ